MLIIPQNALIRTRREDDKLARVGEDHDGAGIVLL